VNLFPVLCRRLLAPGLLTVLLAPAPVRAQDEGFDAQPVVVPAARVDLSIPLRDMPLMRAEPWEGIREVPIKRRRADRRPTLDFLRDPVLQDATATSLGGGGGSVLTNFDGVTNVNGVLPPDTNGDVGPNHYVQWVNLSAQIFNRSGVSLLGPFNGNQFFAGFGGPCQTTNSGDPIVIYDHLADRWVVSQFVSSPPYAICVAISQTPDPTGAYFRYQFNFANFPDYPKMGLWSDGYLVTTRVFNGNTWLGQQAIAMDRARMLQGLSASMIIFNIPDTANIDGFQPADLDGPAPPAGAPGLFAGLPFWGAAPNEVRLYGLSADWVTPANSTFTSLGTFPVAAFSQPNDVAQPGTTAALDALHFFLMYRMQYRNFGARQTLLLNHSVNAGSGRAGVRWYELRKTGASWGLHQQGTYAPADGLSRWMGSMAMNGAGDIGLAYSIASSTLFPSIRFTGQTAASSGTGLMDIPETPIHAGTGSQTNSSGRWGDYSSLSVDPTDDASFWYTTEYVASTGNAPWRTRIARFAFTSPPSPPVASVTPASVGVTLAPGGTTTADVTITNTAAAGAEDLTWTAALANATPLTAPGGASVGAGPAAPRAADGLAEGGKGRDVAGPGQPPALGAGGPDAFGYTWKDSNEPGGPAFAWTDVSAIGTPGPTGDDGELSVALPFSFDFYGVPYTSVTVGTNGVLSFTSADIDFNNTPLPTAAVPNALIAPFWDDLYPPAAGAQIDTYNDVANNRFIVQWTSVPRYDDRNMPAPPTNTFQVVLEADGDILYQYLDMNAPALNSATVGIENRGGTVGLQVVCNAAYVADNLAVSIVHPRIWVTSAPGSGTAAPGESDVVTLSFDAAELDEGTYTADLVVTTNDPTHPSVTVPITLEVETAAPPIVVTEPLPFGVNLTGGLLRVRWTSPSPLTAGPVSITLHRTGGASQVLFASTADDGSQNWPIPAGFSPGPEFTAEVTNLADPGVTGSSEPFAIQTSANQIVVTKPNAVGYAAGQSVAIQWTSPAGFPAGADTRLRLLCPGLPPRGIIGGTQNDGAHTWMVPADIDAAEDCRIDVAGRIAAHQPYFGRSPAFDLSDVAYPTLAVTAPGAGAAWPRGTTQTITWVNNGAPIPGDVKVFLVRSGFPKVRLATTPNDGSFAWAIPAGQAPAANYQIHVEGTYNGRKIKGAGPSFSITPALTAGTAASAVPLETGWTRVVWEGGAPTEASRWLGGLAGGGVTAVAVGPRGALVADAAGRYDGLGALAPGEAVEVWVSGPAALGRTAAAGGAGGTAPSASRYGAPAGGYGASVLLVAAGGLSDGDEVAAYDAAGTLVGVGVAQGGRVALVVRGSSPDGALAEEDEEVEARAPLASGAALTLRRWGAGAASEEAAPLAVTAARRLDAAERSGPAAAAVRYAEGSVWAVSVDAGAPAAQATTAAPVRYALHGAVPNPSSGSTALRFDVPAAAELSVEVYDLLGRRVAVLVAGRVEAGYHAVRWDGSRASAGVYVVRMRAGTFAATQRVTLVR
jgi:hypothetical protein